MNCNKNDELSRLRIFSHFVYLSKLSEWNAELPYTFEWILSLYDYFCFYLEKKPVSDT